MKKLIFLLLITVASYGQTYQNPTFGTITTKTAPTSATDPYVGTVNANGVIGKVAPENIPMNVIPPTTHYTPTTPTLKGHFQGLDNAIGNIPLTTAGNITRIWFTGDATTITAGTFYLTNPTNKGTVANVSQSVINDDNQKKYFTQDLIGQPFATATLFPPGVYAGNLSASTTPNSAQQRFTVELYKCDNNGTPIASGVAGAPVGDLGVTVILILDSGLLTLADGSVTNVPVSASLASQFSIAAGERIRYHVSAEKVGTASSNITESVWYGNSFNSFIDVPTPITSSGVSNVSTVGGATVTNALDNLNVADGQNVKLTGNQTIAGVKTFSSSPILSTPPTTSAGTYDILTRNTSTGVIEKKLNSDFAHLAGTETFTGAKSFNGGSGFTNFMNIYSNIDLYNDSDHSLVFRNITGTPLHQFRSVKSNPFGNIANGIYLQNDITSKFLNVSDDGNLYYDSVIIGLKGDKYNILGDLTSLVNVSFYGDSVTEGANSSVTAKRWTNIVSDKNGFTQTNLGIGGTTMNFSFAGDNSFTDRLPSIPVYNGTQRNLFIAYGINDYLQDWSPAQFEASLSNALNTLITTKGYPSTSIVVITPSIIGTLGSGKNNAGLKPFADACIKVAKARNTSYVDVFNYMLNNGNTTLISGDNIHPNDAGHAVIAEAINYKYFGNFLFRGTILAKKGIISDGLSVFNGKTEWRNEAASVNTTDNSRVNIYTIDATPSIQGATADNTTVKKLALNRFGGNVLVGTDVDDNINKLQISGSVVATQFRISSLNTAPATSTSTGTLGEIRIVNGFIYVCVATNTWQRTSLSTF